MYLEVTSAPYKIARGGRGGGDWPLICDLSSVRGDKFSF